MTVTVSFGTVSARMI